MDHLESLPTVMQATALLVTIPCLLFVAFDHLPCGMLLTCKLDAVHLNLAQITHSCCLTCCKWYIVPSILRKPARDAVCRARLTCELHIVYATTDLS